MLNTKLSETGVTELHPMQLEGTKLRDDGDVEIAMVLAPNDSARAFGYVEFTLRLCVTIGSHLQLELEVQNRGKEPLVCEQAPILISPQRCSSSLRLRTGRHPLHRQNLWIQAEATGERGRAHRQGQRRKTATMAVQPKDPISDT